jgi:hypothetical protein
MSLEKQAQIANILSAFLNAICLFYVVRTYELAVKNSGTVSNIPPLRAAPPTGGTHMNILVALFLCILVCIALNTYSLFLHRILKKSHEKSGLFIESARWGPDSITLNPRKTADRTELVRRLVKGNYLDIPVINDPDMFGDPYVGQGKALWVTYSITRTVKVEETQPSNSPSPYRLMIRALPTEEVKKDEKELRIYRGSRSREEL